MWKSLISWLTTPKPERERDRYDRILEQLSELKAELDDQKRAFKGIELEWDQVYDKLQHQMARIVKRAQKGVQEAAESAQSAEQTTTVPDPLSPIGMHDRLQAMRRRARGVN